MTPHFLSYRCQSLTETIGLYVVRSYHDPPAVVNETVSNCRQACGISRRKPDQRAAFVERPGFCKLGRNDFLSRYVNVAPFVLNLDRGQALGEIAGEVEPRSNRGLANRVNVAILAISLVG